MIEKSTESDADDGFTLIELMVVVLIIAILVAIAIPTFLGSKQRAQDKAAQSNLRNAMVAARTLLVDTGNYATVNTTGLKAIEPSLNFTSTAVAAKDIAIANGSTTFAAAARSDSGTCWQVFEQAGTPGVSGNGVFYGSATGTCTATSVSGSKWLP